MASSPAGSDWSTASHALHRSTRSTARPSTSASSSSHQLIRQADTRPPASLSLLKQEILTEEEYVEGLSDIIKRSFFPQLMELDVRNELMSAYESEDPVAIEESVRKMRELVTPTPRRRARASNTPGRTPFATSPSDTPSYFSSTPSLATPHRSRRTVREVRYDPTLTLDAFQARYTSEDNSSFAVLLAKDNADRRKKNAWAWEAERKANVKAIRGREARERLVDLTRGMVESDKDGIVRLIEGAPGRPGERTIVVDKGMLKSGEGGGRLMVEGVKGSEGRLMITSGENSAEGQRSVVSVIGKGKEKEQDFVDWDKPTVEEEEANKAPKESELQVGVEGWGFTNRNSLMFAPDANVTSERQVAAPTTETGSGKDALPLGEPKGIRYHATRLEQVAAKGDPDNPSPTRSRINAAITGTPYPASSNPTGTPKVSGFSFVDALPTPRAASIDPASLQELMTWGTIESTPIALRSAGSAARSSLGEGGGPFNVRDTSKREALAHRMANKAKRSLSERHSSGGGSSGGGLGLRRSVLDSVRSSRSNHAGGGSTPKTPRDLSPAAKTLLSRTGTGKNLDKGMGNNEEWKADDRARMARASARARELESRDKLKRQRWTPSPAPSLGFDPDMPDQPFLGKVRRSDK